MVHRPMWGWHCQSLGKVCWGSLVAFHFPTGPARADHDWNNPVRMRGLMGSYVWWQHTYVSRDLDSPLGAM